MSARVSRGANELKGEKRSGEGAYQAPLDAVGLDHDEGLLQRHCCCAKLLRFLIGFGRRGWVRETLAQGSSEYIAPCPATAHVSLAAVVPCYGPGPDSIIPPRKKE